MYMIRIPQEKVTDLCENLEKGLRYVGKAMQCIDEVKQQEMGERGGYGMGMRQGPDMMNMGMRGGGGYNGGGYGNRDYDDFDDMMGERRGVRGTGRYSRFN